MHGRTVVGWCAACAVGGIFVGYGLGDRFPFRTNKDFWDILTAVGTLAAASAAVYFGVGTERRAQATSRALAESVAMRLLMDLKGLCLSLRQVRDLFEKPPAQAREIADLVRLVDFGFLDNRLYQLPPAELAVLAVLDPNPVPELAVAFGSFAALEELRANVQVAGRCLLIDSDEGRLVRSGLLKVVTAGLQHLDRVDDVFTASARVKPSKLFMEGVPRAPRPARYC